MKQPEKARVSEVREGPAVSPLARMAISPYLSYTFPMTASKFEWDSEKDTENRNKHGVSFFDAQKAFLDPNRIIARDITHSTRREERFYCFGKIGEGVMTVRFTYRRQSIRIFGAGYWRKGKRIYERENQV